MKMGRRKELSSIVNDLTQSLNSRNNDYLGYWVQGQLCKLAKESDVLILSIPYENIDSVCSGILSEVKDSCVVVTPIVVSVPK